MPYTNTNSQQLLVYLTDGIRERDIWLNKKRHGH